MLLFLKIHMAAYNLSKLQFQEIQCPAAFQGQQIHMLYTHIHAGKSTIIK